MVLSANIASLHHKLHLRIDPTFICHSWSKFFYKTVSLWKMYIFKKEYIWGNSNLCVQRDRSPFYGNLCTKSDSTSSFSQYITWKVISDTLFMKQNCTQQMLADFL